MARTGPFRIDGEDWETDDRGVISRTKPAIPAQVADPSRGRPEALKKRKEGDLVRVNADLAELQAEKTKLEADIANLQTIIDNSAVPAGPALRTRAKVIR